jgi:hypothetical protein
MRRRNAYAARNRVGHQQRAVLMTAWAQVPLPTVRRWVLGID